MSAKKISFLLTSFILSAFIWGFSVQDSKPAKETEFIETVQDIIAGKNIEKSKTFISPEAYVISGAKFENLYDVVSGYNKNIRLTEESSRRMGFFMVKSNEDKTAAFMTCKTVSQNKDQERFHSIVFMKDMKKVWKIVSWHTSD